MKGPNLLIIGAAKSGTTSLHNYLQQHPDIFMTTPKEPHFLINNDIGKDRIPKGIIDKDEYFNLFNVIDSYKYKGESSVMYLAYPEITIKNIKKYLTPHVRIIIMLRNPVERAFSGYHHVKRYNMMEDLTFEEAIKISEDRYKNKHNITPASRYLHLGNYYKQVKPFLKQFTNTHVIIYDDYKRNVNKELEKIFDFLNIKKIDINTHNKYMVGGWNWKNNFIKKIMRKDFFIKRFLKNIFLVRYLFNKFKFIFIKLFTKPSPKMRIKTERWLKDYYRKDVDQLSKLLNRNLNNWIK